MNLTRRNIFATIAAIVPGLAVAATEPTQKTAPTPVPSNPALRPCHSRIMAMLSNVVTKIGFAVTEDDVRRMLKRVRRTKGVSFAFLESGFKRAGFWNHLGGIYGKTVHTKEEADGLISEGWILSSTTETFNGTEYHLRKAKGIKDSWSTSPESAPGEPDDWDDEDDYDDDSDDDDDDDEDSDDDLAWLKED